MAKPRKIRILRCQFIRASDLFEGLTELWDYFCDSDPPFSWGDNNHSLVMGGSIILHMAGVPDDLSQQLTILIDRIGDLVPHNGQIYVDLEN